MLPSSSPFSSTCVTPGISRHTYSEGDPCIVSSWVYFEVLPTTWYLVTGTSLHGHRLLHPSIQRYIHVRTQSTGRLSAFSGNWCIITWASTTTTEYTTLIHVRAQSTGRLSAFSAQRTLSLFNMHVSWGSSRTERTIAVRTWYVTRTCRVPWCLTTILSRLTENMLPYFYHSLSVASMLRGECVLNRTRNETSVDVPPPFLNDRNEYEWSTSKLSCALPDGEHIHTNNAHKIPCAMLWRRNEQQDIITTTSIITITTTSIIASVCVPAVYRWERTDDYV